MFNYSVAGKLVTYEPSPDRPLKLQKTEIARRVRDRELENNSQKDQIKQNIHRNYKNAAKTHPHKALIISDLMSRSVNYLTPNQSIRDAWDLMRRKNIRHIPILTSDKRLVGIVSDRKLLQINDSYVKDPNQEIHLFMTEKVLTASANASLKEAAFVMLEENISALPIVDFKSELLGIISTSDILQALVENAPLELWA